MGKEHRIYTELHCITLDFVRQQISLQRHGAELVGAVRSCANREFDWTAAQHGQPNDERCGVRSLCLVRVR